MATRATSAIKNSKGSYDCIYTHNDGYGHLPILKQHYNSEEKARELVELGGLSVLDEKIHPNPNTYHGMDGWDRKDIKTFKNSNFPTHTIAGRQLGVTLAYNRDRPQYEPMPVQRNLTFRQCFQEVWVYVWSGKRWTRYKVN